ncbi:tyrosine-type recombinase/integrase [Pseudomonas sp. JM0905a]|uniref:tyrosine-type recombinase/integrase n=1 Tax=Pseudomonas sp. JM0905a TaxID=2772484 RepID=UPI0016855807|nr:tyrosine-type recombinase/integrase [Pseudomonas sp. JM0905a]MBD2840601.1 tyrosine-type recombinase/integrase [Pseudomonas sp. JM0905a]
MNTATTWAARVEAYLAYRRSFGFELTIEGGQLESFARFADQRSAERLTLALAADWARASRHPRPISWARRIEVLRGFATFCLRTDPDTAVPPRNLFGPAHRRLVPHIYTDEELRALLEATDRLGAPGSLRPATCRTLFGLLAATGLRISEALKLSRADVDLEAGVLDIRHAKCHQRRFVPLHASVPPYLQAYAQLRDRLVSNPCCDRFFLRDDGRAVDQRSMLYALHLLCDQLGWQVRGDHAHHRLHDLRHTFIVRSALRLYEQGGEVEGSLPALSIYVGHAKVVDTYWYLTGIPELMALAAERFHRYVEGVPT